MIKKKNKLKSKKPQGLDYKAVIDEIEDVDDLPTEMNALLYGPPGSGKTTLAATWPKPMLFIDIAEKGTDSIRNVKGIKVLRIGTQDADEGWRKLENVIWYLKKEGSKTYKSVAIDGITGLAEIAIRRYRESKGQDPDQPLGFATLTRRDWGNVSSDLKQILYSLCDLEMRVVFIAHQKISKGGDDDEDNDDSQGIKPVAGPRVMDSVASILNAAVPIIGNTCIFEHRREVKLPGKKKKEKRSIEYGLRVGPHVYYTAKIRTPKDGDPVPSIIRDPTYEKILALVNGKSE